MQKKILLHSCCGPCSIMVLEYLKKNNFLPHVFYYNPNIHPQKEYLLRLHAMQQAANIYEVPLVIGNNKEFFDTIKKERPALAKTWLKENFKTLFEPSPLMSEAIQKILTKWKNYAELFPCREFENLSVYFNHEHVLSLTFETLQSLLIIDSYAFVSHLSNYKEKERCKECYKERMLKSVFYAREQGFTEFTSTLLYSKYQNHEDICLAIENALQTANKDNANPLHFLYVDFREFWQQGIDKSKEYNIYRQKWCGCILSRLDSLKQMAEREEQKLLRKNFQNLNSH